MKTLFLSCLLFLSGALFAYPSHSPELASPVKKLYQLEETRQLINQVEATGPLTIKAAPLGRGATTAAWYPDQRLICINVSEKRSEASLLRSLVFELHNALNQKQFDYYDQLAMQHKISKSQYVESVERLEYQSALQTDKLLKIGAKKGVFPKGSHWPVAPTFAEQFQIQQEAGHSQFIGELYESLAHNPNLIRR
jgi:hypothetical protein